MIEGILGKARKDYEADAGNELSVKKGDILELINFSDDADWWKAKLNGQEGYLPKDIIDLEKCEVIVDYFDVEEGQLRLTVGDRIEILQKECNKWYGRNSNGEEGHFSPSFIKTIPLTAPPMLPISDSYGTLDSIKPNEVLYDVRKDRPKKTSKHISPNLIPDRKSLLKEPEVKMTPYILQRPEEVILRPKAVTKQAQPWLAELNEKTNQGDFSKMGKSSLDFTPSLSMRKIVKSDKFDDIKNMWKNGIVKETSPKKTEIIPSRHIIHRKSVSNVRDQFETNILPHKKYESRMFQIKSTSISNIPDNKHENEIEIKTKPIDYQKTTITNIQRIPSFGSVPRTAKITSTERKLLETNLTKDSYLDNAPKIVETKNEPEIKVSVTRNYPRGILRNNAAEENILESKTQVFVNEPKQFEEKSNQNINFTRKPKDSVLTRNMYEKSEPKLTDIAVTKYIENGTKFTSNANLIPKTSKQNEILVETIAENPMSYNRVYPSSNDKYAKYVDDKSIAKNGPNLDKSIELANRVEFLEKKVLELEEIICKITNQK